MWKVFLSGVVAIGLLTGGSIAALVAFTGEKRPGGGPGGPAASPRPDDEGPRRPVPAGTPVGTFTYGTQPPAALEPPPDALPQPPPPPPPPPPKGSWEAVPVTARAKSLGRLGALIQARLNDLQDELRTCFTADAQARSGGTPITTAKDAGALDDAGTVLVLVLQLEGQAGAVRIVDAPLEARGPAGDELIACAQNFLRGRVLDVPGASAGTKFRLLFPMSP